MLLRDYEVTEFQNAQHNNRRATKFQTGYILIIQRQLFIFFFKKKPDFGPDGFQNNRALYFWIQSKILEATPSVVIAFVQTYVTAAAPIVAKTNFA